MIAGVRDHRTASALGRSTGPNQNRDMIERYIRAAAAILDQSGHPMGPRRMHTLVHRYVEQVAPAGWTFFDYFANCIRLDEAQRVAVLNHEDVRRAIAYADPTGEKAVRNAMRRSS